VITRNGLKRGFLACATILIAAVVFQIEWPHPFRVTEAFYFLETGSAVGAVAIAILLIATA
jgi:hypothetical protein